MTQHPATLALSIHPDANRIPLRADDSPERLALRASIADVGILEPLLISKGRIVNGRERWLEAKALGKETVPCIEVPEADVLAAIYDSILTRKHFTPDALAYIAWPTLEGQLKASKKRRLANIGKGQNTDSANLHDRGNRQTAEDFAESVGISRRAFFQLRNIVGHFAKDAEMQAHFEPQILSGALTIGQVIQGIAGWASTKGHSRAEREQLVLWQDKIRGFCDPRKFAGWEKADAETRAYVREQLAKGMRDAWPADLRAAVLDDLLNSEGAL